MPLTLKIFFIKHIYSSLFLTKSYVTFTFLTFFNFDFFDSIIYVFAPYMTTAVLYCPSSNKSLFSTFKVTFLSFLVIERSL